jgi:hypothetical protein
LISVSTSVIADEFVGEPACRVAKPILPASPLRQS